MSDSGPSMEEPPEIATRVGIAAPAHRLPASTRLGSVALQVADLDRSISYYQKVLGLRELARDGRVAAMGTSSGDVLIRLQEAPGAVPVPRRGRLGIYHFAILLPDRASLGALLAHLGALGVRPGMSDHGVSEAIYLTDPDGLGIEIYADRPRATWQHRGRELHMTTEPLDVASVLEAVRGPWEGMPPGAVVGHVHLFVGDLDAGADFYHRGLGLDRMVWSYPGALFLSAGGYHHHLGINTWAAEARAAGEGDARLLEWNVVLPDTDSVRVAGEGMAAIGAAVEWGADAWRAADPWGTVVRVATGDSRLSEGR